MQGTAEWQNAGKQNGDNSSIQTHPTHRLGHYTPGRGKMMFN